MICLGGFARSSELLELTSAKRLRTAVQQASSSALIAALRPAERRPRRARGRSDRRLPQSPQRGRVLGLGGPVATRPARHNALVAAGWLVRRFTWPQVVFFQAYVADTIGTRLTTLGP
ncbi:MAG: hypothetical protein ACRCYU_01420 [Nocardioides sp.]